MTDAPAPAQGPAVAPTRPPSFATPLAAAAELVTGFLAPLRAVGWVLRNPTSLIYFVIPCLLMGLLMPTASAKAAAKAQEWLAAYWTYPTDGAYQLPYRVTEGLFWMVAIGGFGVATAWLVSVLCKPLTNRLADRVERVETGVLPPRMGFLRTLVDPLRGVWHGGFNIIFHGLILLPVVAVQQLPGVGPQLAVVLGYPISLTFLALQFADQPMERRRLHYREKVVTCYRNLYAFLGLGAGLSLFMVVPLAPVLLLPIASVAGTLEYIRLERSGRATAPDRRFRWMWGLVTTEPRRRDA